MQQNLLTWLIVFSILWPSILVGSATTSSEPLEQLSLAVGGMMGIWCIGPVKAALEGVPGVEEVILAVGTAIVKYEKGKVKPEDLIRALEEKGFSGIVLEVFSLRVAGMECPGCPKKIEETLIRVPGVRSVSFHPDRKDTIEVEGEKGRVSAQTFFEILKENGFSAEILEERKY